MGIIRKTIEFMFKKNMVTYKMKSANIWTIKSKYVIRNGVLTHAHQNFRNKWVYTGTKTAVDPSTGLVRIPKFIIPYAVVERSVGSSDDRYYEFYYWSPKLKLPWK